MILVILVLQEPASAPDDTLAVVLMLPIAFTVSLAAFLAVVGWAKERRREREALYRHETARRLIEQGQMNHEQFAAFVREEAEAPLRWRREGLKLAGLVLAATGVGLLVGLGAVDDVPVRGIGWMPLAVGLVLFLYATLLAPRAPRR